MKTTYKIERSTTYSENEQFTDVKIWTTEDTETWPQVLKNMVLWLSSIYGYEVLKHVRIHGEPLSEVAFEDTLMGISGYQSDELFQTSQESSGDSQ